MVTCKHPAPQGSRITAGLQNLGDPQVGRMPILPPGSRTCAARQTNGNGIGKCKTTPHSRNSNLPLPTCADCPSHLKFELCLKNKSGRRIGVRLIRCCKPLESDHTTHVLCRHPYSTTGTVEEQAWYVART